MANPQIWPSYLFVSYLFKLLPNFDFYIFSPAFGPNFDHGTSATVATATANLSE